MRKELHIISDGKRDFPRLLRISEEMNEYAAAIHIREKEATAFQLYSIVKDMQARGIPLCKIYMNDRLDVAKVTGVHGVQLKHHSLPVEEVKRHFSSCRIGKSIHSLEEAKKAEQQGADYLLFGHIFATASKKGKKPVGLSGLESVAAAVEIPVIAIGGITIETVNDVIEAGADGIAVMSGIWDADNPVEAVRAYHNKLKL
ncbi:thiamine phosphate synthase [Bacillus chungangensis]|uniref:Thiazole tautomerase (Transcriptional regulator TenI) n=1 Tax=Bacillus chungangensis TaxID=587633 RepID=A0ABT9WRE0_9BACI|nr:thiamine phosphate synthase [Bacillus chungangensis]MDQ0175741.1 thiazole tautomerase (transcriptional regulator TenI) [Bacillus chungangensis]